MAVQWGDIELGEIVDERPKLDQGFISFLDGQGQYRCVLINYPEGAYNDLCTWSDELEDPLFLAYRTYWYSIKERLKQSSHGLTRLYNVYLPKPKGTTE